MSDFDKEAERERLREKYERDREKREATQRMSELLLQGATMTNKHCDDCGDPIFRYDGQEFCPTCQAAGAEDADRAGDARAGDARAGETGEAGGADGTDATGTADAAPNAADADATATDAVTESGAAPDSNAAGGTTPDGAPAENGERAADAATERASERTVEHPAVGGTDAETPVAAGGDGRSRDARTTASARDRGAAGSPRPPNAPATGAGQERSTGAGDGDLTAARASLVRTLARFSREAEDAEDPRRARDHLAAAREAAEAIAALDR